MKKYILIIVALFSINASSQENFNFNQFVQILKEGTSFYKKDIIEINNYSFVKIKAVGDFIIYLPVILDRESENRDFGGYNSGGYALLYDTKRNCYFEIKIDRRGINLEKRDNGLYEVGATLFYEFKEGYSIGIDITMISNNNKKYWFSMGEHKNQIIINSKCIETKFCKVLALDTNLDKLDMFSLFDEIYNLDFNKLYSKNHSFYFR